MNQPTNRLRVTLTLPLQDLQQISCEKNRSFRILLRICFSLQGKIPYY